MGVSWAGLAGGLLGFAPMAAVGIEFLVDPRDEGRALAAAPLAMSAIYLPAVWASVAQTERRQAVLRGSLVASLVLPFTAAFVLASVIPLLALAPATVLLWLALGGPRWRR